MRKDFALCFNEAYVPYACVTIKSITDHMHGDDDVYIHIISDYISERQKVFIRKIADRASVLFYVTRNDIFVNLPDYAFGWTVYAWYRLLLSELLSSEVHRVLYLDCDVIVNDFLDSLFMLDFKGRSMAACIDIETYYPYVGRLLASFGISSDYISSGVILMNLDKWRELNLSTKIIDFVKSYPKKLAYPDQDAINCVCGDDKIILPSRYGVVVNFFRHNKFLQEHYSEMQELMDCPAIIHYAGYQPWIYYKDKSLHSYLWWKTFRSLHSFPQIYYAYFISFIKHWIKMCLAYLKIIRPDNKHYVKNMYYNHPKITVENVMALMRNVTK